MFVDPTGTVSVALPPGWAFDMFSSSLNGLVFLDWQAPSERQTFLRVHGSHSDAAATDDEWEAAVRSGLPKEAPRIERRTGPWLVVERAGREGRPSQRWGIVRGPRFDVTIEHVGVGLGGPLATAELLEAVGSLDVPANRHLGALRPQSEFVAAMNGAHAAFMRGDAVQSANLLNEARNVAQQMWIHSLIGRPVPEVPAAMAVAEATLALARVTGSALFLQQATQTLYRCRATLPTIPAASVPAQMKQVERLLAEALKMHGDLAGAAPPKNPFAASLLRSRLLLRELEGVLRGSQTKLGGPWASAAVEEAMSAVAMAGRGLVRELAPDAAAVFAAQGVTDPSQQLALHNAWLKIAALDHLVAAGNMLVAARAQANLAPDRVVTGNLLFAARQLAEQSPSPQRDRGLVLALSGHASALLDLGDDPSLEEASRLLDEAQARLDGLHDESELRAQICLNQAWLRHTRRQLEGTLPIVERAIATATDAKAERLERAARSLRSQFLALEGRHDEAIAEARKALAATDDDAASTHHLNLAVVLQRAGDAMGAIEEVRAGLAAAAADEPLGPDVLRLLFAAAALLDPVDRKRALAASEAAEAMLDALRLRLGDAADRIGFDDADRHREVAATLVQRRLDLDDVLGALATADRHRARSLIKATRATGEAAADALTTHRPAPPGSGATLDEYITYLAGVAQARLAAAGIPVPPDGRALVDLVARAGRTALVFHPNADRLLILLVRPVDGQIHIAAVQAAASMTEIAGLTEALRAELGIVVSARAARGELPSQSVEDLAAILTDDDSVEEADAELDHLRRRLHDALLSEVLPLLQPGEPLVVVPYRELTVIPFPVLTASDGRSLVERHPLSVLPSLASLDTLAPAPEPPGRAVIIGDPSTSPTLGLGTLPGAAAEARSVAAALNAVGLDTSTLLHADATEAAFRAIARGARLLHLACHAAVRQQAWSSPLFLTPAPPEDGLLLPAEIAELKLDGALVVLAACQSGLGRATADGILGLGRAFMQAGARVVVLSLWRVGDAATAHLMEAFYEALSGRAPGTGGPLDVAAAARHAQLATRDAISSHPSAWGPWIVLGDGGWRLL